MKKATAVFVIFALIFSLAACSDSSEKGQASIMASYSIKSTADDFIVEVQNLGGVYDELYDTEGIYIVFSGEDEIYDADGKKISRSELNIGSTLQIDYSGKLEKKKPKTIQAYKITVIA